MTNPPSDQGSHSGDASTPASPSVTTPFTGGHQVAVKLPMMVTQSPSLMALAGLQQQSDAALHATSATSLLKTINTQAIEKLAATISPNVNAAQLAQMQGFGKSLAAADIFASQWKVATAAASSLNRHHELFAAQIGQIKSAQDAIAQFVVNTDVAKTSALFDTISRYSNVQMQLGAFTTAPTNLLRGITRVPGRRYDSYLAGLPNLPSARRSAVARFSGAAQSGMTIAESLTSNVLDDDDREELAANFNTDVLEPWQAGTLQAQENLYAALAALEPGHEDWLKSAWGDIKRDGPKAAANIANCAIECIDHTLRVVAAVDNVQTWIAVVGAQSGWLEKGRPTRRAKVMFAMWDRSVRDACLAVLNVEAAVNLIQSAVKNLQSVKHGEAPTIVVMRSWVMITESALSLLLLDH